MSLKKFIIFKYIILSKFDEKMFLKRNVRKIRVKLIQINTSFFLVADEIFLGLKRAFGIENKIDLFCSF